MRLGVLGCGWVTRERHLPALRRVPEVAVVAVADPDPTADPGRAARTRAGPRSADWGAVGWTP